MFGNRRALLFGISWPSVVDVVAAAQATHTATLKITLDANWTIHEVPEVGHILTNSQCHNYIESAHRPNNDGVKESPHELMNLYDDDDDSKRCRSIWTIIAIIEMSITWERNAMQKTQNEKLLRPTAIFHGMKKKRTNERNTCGRISSICE